MFAKKIFKTVLNEIFEYNDDDFGNTKKWSSGSSYLGELHLCNGAYDSIEEQQIIKT